MFHWFTNAFGSLNQEILLEKLKNYGYRGPIHKILADYPSERFQYVSIRKELVLRESFELDFSRVLFWVPFVFLYI